MHERLVGIGLGQHLTRVAGADRPCRHGGEDPARHRRQDGRHGQAERTGRLLDLGHVLVGADLVRRQVPHHLGAEQVPLGRAAGAAGAARGHDDDIGGVDQAGRDERGQGEDDRGGVATAVGHPRAGGDRVPLAGQLGQPERPRLAVVTAVRAVPGLGVAEPVVGTEVDHLAVPRQGCRERSGLTVRQRQEDDVGLGESGRTGPFEDPVGQLRQVRVQVRDALPRRAAGAQRAELEVGVLEQQAQQLTAGVAAGSRYRCCHAHPLSIHDPA